MISQISRKEILLNAFVAVGKDQTITYAFNTLNKLQKIIDQEGLEETFTYDPEGNLLEHINRNGNKVLYEFNMYGSLLRRREANSGLSESYTYDLNGNKISQRDVTGKTVKYSYNALDELTEIIDNETKLASYTYHPDGSLATMQQLNGLYTQYS